MNVCAAANIRGVPNEYERLTTGGLCGWLRADNPPMGVP